MATISRLLKSIGLFCKRALQKRPIFSKETYNFKEPTNRSHPISYNIRRYVDMRRVVVSVDMSTMMYINMRRVVGPIGRQTMYIIIDI